MVRGYRAFCYNTTAVPGPNTIGLRHVERSVQGILSHRQAMRGLCRRTPFAGALRSNLRRSHQLSNVVLANAEAFCAQFLRDPHHNSGVSAGGPRESAEQPTIGLRSGALRPIQPGVVAGGRNLGHRAHQLHCKATSVVLDGSVLHLRSFAKNAAARFKKSRSWSPGQAPTKPNDLFLFGLHGTAGLAGPPQLYAPRASSDAAHWR